MSWSIGEIIEIVFYFLLIIAIFISLCACVYFTIRYYEINQVIKQCDKDFGKGNWTFEENKEYYSCSTYKKNIYEQKIIKETYTENKTCYLNNNLIDC